MTATTEATVLITGNTYPVKDAIKEPALETLLPWGPPREVTTKYGARVLRKATPGPGFWITWAEHGQALMSRGLSLSKDLKTGQPQVCWWAQVREEDLKKREETTLASRAASTGFAPPRPEGLDYYPFQKAGVAFALDVLSTTKEGGSSHPSRGVLIADEMG